MKSSFELLWDWGRKKMNLDEQFQEKISKSILNELVNENVIRFHLGNTLDTNTKQNQNPRNESFGGFFIVVLTFLDE